MRERNELYIGGELVKPDGKDMIDVRSPSTGKVIGRVPEGASKDVDKAVNAARGALGGWMLPPGA